jgi:hypothetical protein
MYFVERPVDIRTNVLTLHRLASSRIHSERKYHRERIRKAHALVWTRHSGTLIFGPSRFVGYRQNSIRSHEQNRDKHGGETNVEISRVLNDRLLKDTRLEVAFQHYCQRHGIVPENRTRRYWRRGV